MKQKWIELAHENRGHMWPTYLYWRSAQEACKLVDTPPGLYGVWYENDGMSYITTEGGLANPGRAILQRLKDDPQFITHIEKVNTEQIPLMLKASEPFLKDLRAVPGVELFTWFEEFLKKFYPMMQWSVLGTVMEFEEPLMSTALLEVLKKKTTDQSAVSTAFIALTSATRQTIAQKAERRLIEIRMAHAGGMDTAQELEAYRQEYSFIGFGYDGPGWSAKDVREMFDALPPDSDALAEKYAEMNDAAERLETEQQQWTEKLKFSAEEQRLFSVLRNMGFWKFERKFWNQKSHQMMEDLFVEIARRYTLSVPQAKMILPEEMHKVLTEGRVDPHILNARLKRSFALFDGYDERRTIVGADADTVHSELSVSLTVDETLTEAHGDTAYPGTAEGVVCVIIDEAQTNHFEEGNILVAPSTSPKLVPLMKKAAAIVTDSGGITSHAAIVAREIKVPTLIGTKISSKIFKNGDAVLVDAEKGIVKLVQPRRV